MKKIRENMSPGQVLQNFVLNEMDYYVPGGIDDFEDDALEGEDEFFSNIEDEDIDYDPELDSELDFEDEDFGYEDNIMVDDYASDIDSLDDEEDDFLDSFAPRFIPTV